MTHHYDTDQFVYDRVPRLCICFQVYRQRTGYRIRERLLRGQILFVQPGPLPIARLGGQRGGRALRKSGQSPDPEPLCVRRERTAQPGRCRWTRRPGKQAFDSSDGDGYPVPPEHAGTYRKYDFSETINWKTNRSLNCIHEGREDRLHDLFSGLCPRRRRVLG